MTLPFPITVGDITIPVGIGPPNVLAVGLQNDPNAPSYATPLDFTTVTGVVFRVTRERDLSTAEWATTDVSSVTTAGLVASYAYQLGDVPIEGPYVVRAWASVTGKPNAIPLLEFTITVTPL